MTRFEIEHMWKVASNDPHHDYNWNDAVVIAFAKLVAQHEREACAKVCDEFPDVGYIDKKLTSDYHAHLIRQRGQA